MPHVPSGPPRHAVTAVIPSQPHRGTGQKARRAAALRALARHRPSPVACLASGARRLGLVTTSRARDALACCFATSVMTHEQGLNYLGVTRSELRKVGSQPSFFLCTVQTKCGSGSRFRGYTSAGQAPTLVDATQIRGLQMVRLWTFMEQPWCLSVH